MASNNWAKVYFHDIYAGILEEQTGGRCCFSYDKEYIKKYALPLSINLPIDQEEHYYEGGLHPFFDNLVAEGWLAELQAKAIGVNPSNRFKLLIAFGRDCTGAVSVIDPDPNYQVKINSKNIIEIAAIKSRASMSGVQPKVFVRLEKGKYYLSAEDQGSTHIAKLPGKYPFILENEFICTLAAKILLAPDQVVEPVLGKIEGCDSQALLIKRFDRDNDGKKIHFEEFTQLLNYKSNDKYSGDYVDLANFINNSPLCSVIDLEKLFRRILVCILLGNGDAHLKNFAMYHTEKGLDLTPVYDMVFTAYYGFKGLALGFSGISSMSLGDIKSKHLIKLCKDFKLNIKVLELAVQNFEARLDKVYRKIEEQRQIPSKLRKEFIREVRKRWNGIFKSSKLSKLIGKKS